MDIFQTIEKNDLLKVGLIVLAVYLFMNYYQEHLDNTPTSPIVPVTVDNSNSVLAQPSMVSNVPVVPVSSTGAPGSLAANPPMVAVPNVTGQTQLTTSDLLPQYNDASDFAKQNPVSSILQDQNFLQTGYHIGVNTSIQSNKIPYLDIRSCPPIVKQQQGPWNQSSYEETPGAKRRGFEIGQ